MIYFIRHVDQQNPNQHDQQNELLKIFSLRYDLMQLLLQDGDDDEIEIRGGSIYAVHSIVNQVNEEIPLEKDLRDQGLRLNFILLDVFLWRRRPRQYRSRYQQTPFHRTRSIFY